MCRKRVDGSRPRLSLSRRKYSKRLCYFMPNMSHPRSRSASPTMPLQAKLPKKKLPLIEKKTTAAVKSPKIYSFASKRRNSYTSPLTAFGSASMTKKLPSMQFKRIIPAHVYKSRHATKEQIAIQARLRRSLSRQKIRKFKEKLKRVFEEKASHAAWMEGYHRWLFATTAAHGILEYVINIPPLNL